MLFLQILYSCKYPSKRNSSRKLNLKKPSRYLMYHFSLWPSRMWSYDSNIFKNVLFKKGITLVLGIHSSSPTVYPPWTNTGFLHFFSPLFVKNYFCGRLRNTLISYDQFLPDFSLSGFIFFFPINGKKKKRFREKWLAQIHGLVSKWEDWNLSLGNMMPELSLCLQALGNLELPVFTSSVIYCLFYHTLKDHHQPPSEYAL